VILGHPVPSGPSAPRVLEKNLWRFVLGQMFSCYTTIGIRSPKETNTNPDQWPGLILSSSTTRLLVEGRCWCLYAGCDASTKGWCVNTQTQPFHGLFPGTTWVSWCQKKKTIWTFIVQGKITQADTPTIRLVATPSGLISNPPANIPPFLRRTPFLPQPSHFILAWDRHQICWLAYPVA